ncbi:sulfur transferase domain-containing protein [Stenotrophomonas sp. HITSZ_GD]|uniref:beta-lactamase hydrolase domain-containing protein n=1 Tax=Stenotrophomonas sp. HITSZ_GD TaxID=3037248 RepID=UPI00240E6826|nr:sulfur transferase domain-containing protein [Stenotrophomonas sp. HITSZ_GD]MDG2525050.1 sulfur transferase domain-containing protein [Stenotrophomonas sp. HITSZ_GD]
MPLPRLLCLLLLMLPLLAQAEGHAPRLVHPALYAGGQPDEATLRALAAQGVTTVIDLRGAEEPRGYAEADTARALGLRYIALPVAGAQDITPANAQALQSALDTAQGPVLLHCASGNRVGALLALSAHARGASDEEALAEGRAAGLGSLEPTVRARFHDAAP